MTERAGNDARSREDPLVFDAESVPFAEPPFHGFEIGVGDLRIAENAVAERRSRASSTGGAARKSMSATHIGSTRSSVARSHLTELVPRRGIISSKSYFITLKYLITGNSSVFLFAVSPLVGGD